MTQVTNTVRFVLDGQIVEAVGVRRTTTLLDHLREKLHRHGRKFTPKETLRRVVGDDMNVAPYIRYLKAKFSEIYNIK